MENGLEKLNVTVLGINILNKWTSVEKLNHMTSLRNSTSIR